MGQPASEAAALGWTAWFTVFALALMVAAMVRGWARTEHALLGTLGLLLVAGVVTPEQAFAGFANPAVVAIASLFVVAAGVERTGAVGALDRYLKPRSERLAPAIGKLFFPVALMSAVLNNTPIVAMFIPRVQAWARSTGIPASKLLMPLSTAAIVGGWLTLVGTSTNVVVHGLLLAEGYDGFSFFDLAWVGVPAVIVVGAYYALAGHRLLPERGGESLEEVSRDYQFDLRVGADAPFLGQTVEEAGLRTLGEAYLAYVRRDNDVSDVAPDTRLNTGDVLTFVGSPGAHDLLIQRAGLERTAPTVGHTSLSDFSLVEAVVGQGSRLAGRSLQDVEFRERYGGVVLAIQRRDEPMQTGLGRVPLRAGDLLLVEGRRGLGARLRAFAGDFALVSELDSVRPVTSRAPIALAILAGTLGTVVLGLLPLATAAFAGALGIIVTGCLRGPALRRAIDVPVILVIAAALGVGQAVESVGLVEVAAGALNGVSSWVPPVVVLLLVYLMANGLAELVTNKASAVLMLPVALGIAGDLGLDWKPFAVAVAVGSAASFLTPIGYQTNLMVMGAGGYAYTDYTRAGLPVSLLVMAITVSVCALRWL